MHKFLGDVHSRRYDEPVYVPYNPTQPPMYKNDTDLMWEKTCKTEPKFEPGTYHKALDMDERLLTKPRGSLDIVMVHHGPWRDVPDENIGTLLEKLGHGHAQGRDFVMFGFDLFSRRLDRAAFRTEIQYLWYTPRLDEMAKALPESLTKQWFNFAHGVWQRCTAPITLLLGADARKAREKWVAQTPVTVTAVKPKGDNVAIKCTGVIRPWSYIERNGNGEISRLVFVAYHSEVLKRSAATTDRNSLPRASYRLLAERLIDNAAVIAYEIA
ncbi:hypothetical protein T440DRAFT_525354 [Plenodomus tracheiphilus IPT5]|uniref:Uncharacterized protein n=1 Tax=Plenodomus tracheiphilus IPT5 TaxID=1408161 RepID=A0A6A7BBR0_9PLEO|nr:hypothetical protein T440DRAFT_525354 [Plenodomus tracheiphilus IPT5]